MKNLMILLSIAFVMVSCGDGSDDPYDGGDADDDAGDDDSGTDDDTETDDDTDTEDPCENVDCNDHGECIEVEGEGVCNCDIGYDPLTDCGTCATGYVDNPLSPGECILDPCDGITCSGNGTCDVLGPISYECNCDNDNLNVADDCATCETGYANYPTCDTCDTGYTEWPLLSGICIVDLCDGVTCSGNGTCDDPSVGTCDCDTGYDGADCSTCDTGYTEWPLLSGVCILDQCDGQTCYGNGTCDDPSTGVCSCDNAYLDDTDDCGSCVGNQDYADDCNSCLPGYDNYPSCTPDVTAPADPVITTNGGVDFPIYQADFDLDGTCTSDTYTMWVSIDGGVATQITGYTSYSTSWSWSSSMGLFETHEYCFHAEDYAGNPSGQDCVNITRPS